MARFTNMEPDTVIIGRGAAAARRVQEYVDGISGSAAGCISLDPDDRPTTAKRYLAAAAKTLGIRVRSTYVEGERALYWKRVGA